MSNTLIVEAIDAPSPNVGSGLALPYGIATTTEEGVSTAGTGQSLSTATATTTIPNHITEVVPSTIPVPAISPSSANVNCGKPAAFAGVAATSISMASGIDTN
jgi:hypothetical protein